jgi:hypothetical protein
MKVRELIAKLSGHDQELDVLCYTEDSGFLPEKHLFRLLEIDDVVESEGERLRGEDHIPTLKLGNSSNSEKFALINVVSDF